MPDENIVAEQTTETPKQAEHDHHEKKTRKPFLKPGTKTDIRNILLVVIPIVLLYLFAISQLKQFPGPLYGGDIYWHYGETLNIYNGAAPWENAQVSGEYAYYGWLSPFLTASLAKITGIDLAAMFLYFPVLVAIIAGIVSYYLGLEIFKKRLFAAMFCLLSIGLAFYISSPWRALEHVFMPLFILFLIRLLDSSKMKYAIATGLVFGVAALSHVSLLPSMALIVFFAFLYSILRNHVRLGFHGSRIKFTIIKSGKHAWLSSIKKSLILFVPLAIIGILIALLFYFPYFVYQGGLKNPTNVYARPDLSRYGLENAASTLAWTFFDIADLVAGNVFQFIFSLLTLLGLYAIIKYEKNMMMIILVAASIIGGFHYLVTAPLLGTYLIPDYIYSATMGITAPLLVVFAIKMAYEKTEKYRKLIAVAAVIFISIGVLLAFNSAYSTKWMDVGRQPQNAGITALAEWVSANTDTNAVFLSSEEPSFLLNGLTARKVMISRRTHFSHFLDIDTRIADAAVILYGNTATKSLELLKKYNVSYIYWDANWMYFAQNEPSMVPPSFEGYLTEYGVRFDKINTYLDPAWSPQHPKYDMLAIYPAKNDPAQPWTDELQTHLKLLKTFSINDQAYARIYEIDYSSF